MLTNVEFFHQINQDIHPLAEEVTICSGKIEENLFDAKTVPQEILWRLVDEMGQRFGVGVDLKKLQQFSFQAADKISYFEDKFMLVYSGGEEDYKESGLSLHRPHDDYCINYYCESKKSAVKFYDLEVNLYSMPSLPQGSELAYPFGHGVGTLTYRQDVYFCHHDIKLVSEFFNLPMPTSVSSSKYDLDPKVMKVFGLTYDVQTLKPMKLKRYFYPQDPAINFTLYDEVRS
jgi:hypothetical protein